MKKHIFMDTAFLLAVLDTSDKYHNLAMECYKKLIMPLPQFFFNFWYGFLHIIIEMDFKKLRMNYKYR